LYNRILYDEIERLRCWQRRERPKLLFDKDGTPTHLYNGTTYMIPVHIASAAAAAPLWFFVLMFVPSVSWHIHAMLVFHGNRRTKLNIGMFWAGAITTHGTYTIVSPLNVPANTQQQH
jgi:hypothetical protein